MQTTNEVLEISHGDIEPPPEFGAHVRSDFIKGMGKINDKFVIILNANKVLSVDELSMLGQATATMSVDQAEAA